MTNPALKLALEKLLHSMESEFAEDFLGLLLDAMRLVFLFDRDYRNNIDGFRGRYLFRSQDREVSVAATFNGKEMEVSEEEVADPNVTVIFKDGKALMHFLLSGNPDILGSMLRQEVTPEGNLNYLYKFAYLARRLQLMATGQA